MSITIWYIDFLYRAVRQKLLHFSSFFKQYQFGVILNKYLKYLIEFIRSKDRFCSISSMKQFCRFIKTEIKEYKGYCAQNISFCMKIVKDFVGNLMFCFTI